MNEGQTACIIAALIKRLGVDEVTLSMQELEAMHDNYIRIGELYRTQEVKIIIVDKERAEARCKCEGDKHSISCPLGFRSIFPDLHE